ncbi:MAG: MBL fold metallo-hydrolase [Ktedonobacteraceae bacterium]
MTQLNGAQIMWLGHATFKVTTPQNKVILLDPWIERNPKSPPEARQLDRVDLILVSHGHFDHINDVVPTRAEIPLTGGSYCGDRDMARLERHRKYSGNEHRR